MKLYGLIGYPLGHSFSARYFAEKFVTEGISHAQYRNFEIENIGLLPQIIADNPDLKGFNVTIPYKEAVISYLDGLNEDAAKIGAVNCVKISERGLIGYNTDVVGFRNSLLNLLGEVRPAKALILGTGGASKAVAYVLGRLGIKYTFVSRNPAAERLSYDDLTDEVIASNKLIVNTTPLGTYPKTEECPPIPYDKLGEGHFLFDLVYNPAQTEFMRKGILAGAVVSNGYDMLVGQAEEAWRVWNSGD